jgi:hypothetical protein
MYVLEWLETFHALTWTLFSILTLSLCPSSSFIHWHVPLYAGTPTGASNICSTELCSTETNLSLIKIKHSFLLQRRGAMVIATASEAENRGFE